MKHQAKAYRIINGVKMSNFCDLVFSDIENAKVIAEAKRLYKKVRRIKHASGFTQLFVA